MDWNNDGRKDLIAGERNGPIRIYLNAGTDANPTFNGYSFLQVGGATYDCGLSAKPDIVDWNNDGRKDVVCGDDDGNVHLLLNTGTDANPAFATSVLIQSTPSRANLDVGTRASPVVVDWDYDGKKDLIVGETYGNLFYFKNVGTDANPAFAGSQTMEAGDALIDVGYYSRPDVTDWNNDGTRDVLCGDSNGRVWLFIGIGQIRVSIPATATEGDGTLVGQGMVSIDAPALSNTVVILQSADTSEVTVPGIVTILEGNTNATFDVGIVDDGILDGTREVLISAVAGLSATIAIHDDESAILTVALPTSATEGNAPLVGTVSVSAAPDENVKVTLTSDDTTEVTVQGQAIIPAGQVGATFPVVIVDDTAIDGTQVVQVTAHIENWTDGSDSMTVYDNENLDLVVAPPALVGEGQGTLVDAGTVTISGTLAGDLSVSLLSGDTSELTVPATMTIPAGQLSGAFNVTVVDDLEHDGQQTAAVSASAAGFGGDSDTTVVADNEVSHLTVSAIASPQTVMVPFGATVTAHDINGDMSSFSGSIALSGSGDGGVVFVNPGAASFANGQWVGGVSINTVDTNVRLVADGAGHSVTSGAFDVRAGPLDHFVWDAISSPQCSQDPFDITVSAMDVHGYPCAAFGGTVALSGISGQGEKTIGTGPASWNYPMRTYWHDSRTQVIYLQAEIGGPTVIKGLALNVTVLPGQTMNAWTIRMKHTSMTQYSSSPVWEGGDWTVVYQADETVSNLGWVWFPFSSDFHYNGSDSLIIDFSHNNTSWTSDGQCRYTAASQNRSLYYYTDSGFGDPLAWTGTSPTPNLIASVPDIKLLVGSPVAVAPGTSDTFVGGVWTGAVEVLHAATAVRLIALHGNSQSGMSNPFSVTNSPFYDGDGDGMPDGWEDEHFGGTNVSSGDVHEDYDGDGSCDLHECLAGTDPTNSSSCLAVADVDASGSTRARSGLEHVLTWQSVTGKFYSIQRTPDLLATWTNIAADLAATPPLNVYTDAASPPDPAFYRVRLRVD